MMWLLTTDVESGIPSVQIWVFSDVRVRPPLAGEVKFHCLLRRQKHFLNLKSLSLLVYSEFKCIFQKHIKKPHIHIYQWTLTRALFLTYAELGDDVGRVSVCFFLCALDGTEHMKQLLYSFLQQPGQSKPSAKAAGNRKKRKVFIQKGETLSTSKCVGRRPQNSPVCRRLQT